jgi:hypothetical protein
MSLTKHLLERRENIFQKEKKGKMHTWNVCHCRLFCKSTVQFSEIQHVFEMSPSSQGASVGKPFFFEKKIFCEKERVISPSAMEKSYIWKRIINVLFCQ